MESMTDLMKKLGWIAWCLTVIGWFLSPIISLLMNKIFTYLVFNASKKLTELENEIISRLKHTLGAVEEQTVLRAAEDNPSQSDLKILDNMKMDLKSALYEAEDILDLRNYRQIEKDLHHVDDDSVWVENQLGAACALIARCKGSWYGQWIYSTFAAVMKSAQSMIQHVQLVIQRWLFSIGRSINIAGAPVLQCAQRLYRRLRQLIMSDTLPKSGMPLLPVSNPTQQPRCLQSRGSESVPADTARMTAKEMVDKEEIMEETHVEEGEGDKIKDGEVRAMLEEIEGESCEGEARETSKEEIQEEEVEDGEEGETSEEEIEEESCEEVEETSEEEIQEEEVEEGEEGETEVEDGEEGETSEEEIEEESCEEVEETSEEEIQEEEGEEGETSMEWKQEVVGDGEEGETSRQEEIKEERCEGEVEETLQEEIKGESCEVGEQERKDNEEGKQGDSTSLSILHCARSMLTWFKKACSCRDWSYGIVGIQSDKKDASATESLPITERINLKNRIKHIEYILDTSRKSDLLNDEKSSSGTTKDSDKERSSSTVKNSANESSSKQKEIDELSRDCGREVFGREKDRADISRMLRQAPDTYAAISSSNKPYSVIGIYGISGSGKTTLAKYVHDLEMKAGYFDTVMFIHVGKTFSVGDIFRDMMKQITDVRPPKDEGLKSLKTKLKETLKDKCFLLVLDDLWVNDANQKELEILLDMLTLSAARSGSRVLVTSQKTDAAEALGAQEQIPIPDLEEGVYLSLLMHHALPHDASDDEYRKYENIGRRIANRLCRSPIAAVTVGKQLRRNKRISFWETTANLEVLNKTMGALWWSYQQLGDDVRRCFAYCSTFPKGYELERDELVRIWIAQGFVNTRNNAAEELEDVGQRYFEELLTFSFLQVDNETATFTIHDLLHEFAERISGSEFFRIGLNDSPEDILRDIPRGVHHLFIENRKGVQIAEKLVEVENLRTLIVKDEWYTFGRIVDSEKLLERLFMRMTKLRVLIIKQYDVVEKLSVPACIDRMKHLRYLGLHFIYVLSVLKLPSTFSKLYHIEIIDIPFKRASHPEDMANLTNLRHITNWLNLPNIENVGRLTSLRTMRSFEVKAEERYRLKRLKNLNKLGGTLIIEGLDIVPSKKEALEAHLSHKERLRKLMLRFSSDKRFRSDVESISEFIFTFDYPEYSRFSPDVEAEVLEGLCPPKHLDELHIKEYKGSRYPSWMLSRQHSDIPKQLHKLVLYDCSQLASIPEDSELFIGLRKLSICHCDWVRLPENMECLVSLQELKISHCHEIKLLPTLPHQALKKISIHWCSVLSRTCKERGHDNWYKIRHILERDIEVPPYF